MEIPKFTILSDHPTSKLPDKINDASLAEWLVVLGKSTDNDFFCSQVCTALKALNENEIAPKLRFTLLDKIQRTGMPFVQQMEQSLLETPVPLSDVQRANYQLLTATYASLAQGYWRVGEDIAALPQQAPFLPLFTKSSFFGLEALKRVLLHTMEVYELPYPGFWKACYQFYQRAENYQLLDSRLEEVSSPCHSIAASFKSLLALYLSGHNQFNSKDIKKILKYLEHFSDYAAICQQIEMNQQQQFFKFSLDHDIPPLYSNLPYDEHPGLRYLSTTKLAKIVSGNLDNTNKLAVTDFRGLKPQHLAVLVKNLGLTAHRKSIRMAIKKDYWGIIGFDNILNYLRKRATGEPAEKIESFDAHIAGTEILSDLHLLSMEDSVKQEKNVENEDYGDRYADLQFASTPQGQAQKLATAEAQFGEFTVIDGNATGYGLAFKGKQINAEIDEFIAFIIADDSANIRCEIGIIRRIGISGNEEIRLGVELISSSAEAACIYRKGHELTKHWAVILSGIKTVKQQSIICSSQFFQIGDAISWEQADTIVDCRIGKLLHAATSSIHAELLVE